MNIKPIDDHKDLFLVNDAFSNFFLNHLSVEKLLKYDFNTDVISNKYNRKNLKLTFFTKFLIDHYSKVFENRLSKFLNCRLRMKGYNIWLDEEGFFMDRHIDNNGDPVLGLHIYLNTLENSVGTCFYRNNQLRYQFPYIRNTGYLMINHKNQEHSAGIPVPQGCYRSSVYYWFDYC